MLNCQQSPELCIMSSFDCHRARRSSQKTLGIFGTKPSPLTVEFVKVYRGPLHKNEQLIIISLLVGGGIPPTQIQMFVWRKAGVLLVTIQVEVKKVCNTVLYYLMKEKKSTCQVRESCWPKPTFVTTTILPLSFSYHHFPLYWLFNPCNGLWQSL